MQICIWCMRVYIVKKSNCLLDCIFNALRNNRLLRRNWINQVFTYLGKRKHIIGGCCFLPNHFLFAICSTGTIREKKTKNPPNNNKKITALNIFQNICQSYTICYVVMLTTNLYNIMKLTPSREIKSWRLSRIFGGLYKAQAIQTQKNKNYSLWVRA